MKTAVVVGLLLVALLGVGVVAASALTRPAEMRPMAGSMGPGMNGGMMGSGMGPGHMQGGMTGGMMGSGMDHNAMHGQMHETCPCCHGGSMN